MYFLAQKESLMEVSRSALSASNARIQSLKGKLRKGLADCQSVRREVGDAKAAISAWITEAQKQTQNDLLAVTRRANAADKDTRHTNDKLKSEEKAHRERMRAIEMQYRPLLADLSQRAEAHRQRSDTVPESDSPDPAAEAVEKEKSPERSRPEGNGTGQEVKAVVRTLSYKQPSSAGGQKSVSFPQKKQAAVSDLDIETFLGSAATSLLTRNKK